MSIDGLKSSYLLRKIDYQKYTTSSLITIILDVTFQNYFKYLFIEDVICEKISF